MVSEVFRTIRYLPSTMKTSLLMYYELFGTLR
jgi:hypothetical protein